MTDLGERKRQVSEVIMRYLRVHPEASDTAEGIRDWWLEPDERDEELALVEDVLNELVNAGVMKQQHLPDGGVLYSGTRR